MMDPDSLYEAITPTRFIEQAQMFMEQLIFSLILLDSLTAWSLPITRLQFRIIRLYHRHIPLIILIALLCYGSLCLCDTDSSHELHCVLLTFASGLSMQCRDDLIERLCETPSPNRNSKNSKSSSQPSMYRFALSLTLHALIVFDWLYEMDAVVYFMGCIVLGRVAMVKYLSVAVNLLVMALLPRKYWTVCLLLYKCAFATLRGDAATDIWTYRLRLVMALAMCAFVIDIGDFQINIPLTVQLAVFASVVLIVIGARVLMNLGLLIQTAQNIFFGEYGPRKSKRKALEVRKDGSIGVVGTGTTKQIKRV